jgi:polygalacturonase
LGAWADDVKIYPFPSGVEPAKDFTIKINGRNAFVYDSSVGAIVHFESSALVNVEIECINLDVKNVTIRPAKYALNYVIKEGVIMLQVPVAVDLSVEFNGNITRPLFIFANVPDKNKPDSTASNTRFFKAGHVYVTGPVQLKENERVYIEGGAIVRGSFKADSVSGVIIGGPGIIDGTNVRGEEEYREAVKNYRQWRKLVHFKNCQNVTIENVILLNSNAWNIVPDNSDGVIVNHIRIICGNPSDDGIDILQSSNVLIKNSFIRTKDDCIAIKSLFESIPDKISKNIKIENCVLWAAEWGNVMEIGFETLTASIEDVILKDCDIIHAEGGAVFSIHNSDYAIVKNIRYENIRIEDARDIFIDLAIFVSLFSKDNPYDIDEFRKNYYLRGTWNNVMKIPKEKSQHFSRGRGQIENIKFSNITLRGMFPYSIINGFDNQHRIKDVRIKNLKVNGEKIKNAKDAKLFQQFAENVIFE